MRERDNDRSFQGHATRATAPGRSLAGLGVEKPQQVMRQRCASA
jgi:hypothetical protein